MVRFILAAIILLPFVVMEIKKGTKNVLLAGIVLGALNTVVYVSQTIGMQTLTSAQGSFITGISVVLVSFILPFFSLGKPTAKDILCSSLCFLWLFFLVNDDLSHIGSRALWVLLCAFFVSVTIVYLQKVSSNLSYLALLAFYQIVFTAVFTAPFTLGKCFHTLLSSEVAVAILFCAVFATSIALLLQTKYQHYTTANRAAMIFCFEPIFGSLFGYLINGEKIGWPIFFGGVCIFFGIILSLLNINKKGIIECEV